MKRALLLLAILVAALVGGATTRVLTSVAKNAAPPYAIQLARNLLSELNSEGRIDVSTDLIEAFVEQNHEHLQSEFARQKKRWRAEKSALRDLLRMNYRGREELDALFVEDPRVAEKLTFLVIHYEDGKRGSVFVDAADWPTIFEKGEFGYGAENGFKADLLRAMESWLSREAK